jgi:hypothetical protein
MWPLRVPLLVVRTATNETSQSLQATGEVRHVGLLSNSRPTLFRGRLSLAATATGMAPCALGGGDADRFARAAGTDYHAETSVGEFLLGSQRHGPMSIYK